MIDAYMWLLWYLRQEFKAMGDDVVSSPSSFDVGQANPCQEGHLYSSLYTNQPSYYKPYYNVLVVGVHKRRTRSLAPCHGRISPRGSDL